MDNNAFDKIKLNGGVKKKKFTRKIQKGLFLLHFCVGGVWNVKGEWDIRGKERKKEDREVQVRSIV